MPNKKLHVDRNSKEVNETQIRSGSRAPSESSNVPASAGTPQATGTSSKGKSVGKQGATGVRDAPVAGIQTDAQVPGSEVGVISKFNANRGSGGHGIDSSMLSEAQHGLPPIGLESSRTSGSPSRMREARTGKSMTFISAADDRTPSIFRGRRSPTPEIPVRHVANMGQEGGLGQRPRRVSESSSVRLDYSDDPSWHQDSQSSSPRTSDSRRSDSGGSSSDRPRSRSGGSSSDRPKSSSGGSSSDRPKSRSGGLSKDRPRSRGRSRRRSARRSPAQTTQYPRSPTKVLSSRGHARDSTPNQYDQAMAYDISRTSGSGTVGTRKSSRWDVRPHRASRSDSGSPAVARYQSGDGSNRAHRSRSRSPVIDRYRTKDRSGHRSSHRARPDHRSSVTHRDRSGHRSPVTSRDRSSHRSPGRHKSAGDRTGAQAPVTFDNWSGDKRTKSKRRRSNSGRSGRRSKSKRSRKYRSPSVDPYDSESSDYGDRRRHRSPSRFTDRYGRPRGNRSTHGHVSRRDVIPSTWNPPHPSEWSIPTPDLRNTASLFANIAQAIQDGSFPPAGPTSVGTATGSSRVPPNGKDDHSSPSRDRNDLSDAQDTSSDSDAHSTSDEKMSLRADSDDPIIREEGNRTAQVSTASGTEPKTNRTIRDCYNIVFETLPEDDCARPPPLPPKVPGSLSERLVKNPGNENPQEEVSVQLPVSTVVKTALSKLESANKAQEGFWKAPTDIARMSKSDTSYRPPRPDITSGLDLANIPKIDKDAKVLLKIPTISSQSTFPCTVSSIELWEGRDRRAMGLASQIDFLSSSLIQKLAKADLLDDDTRTLGSFLGQSTQMLASVTAANAAEMLCVRRDLTLKAVPEDLLSDRAVSTLRTAPLSSPHLFGGMCEQVKSQNDQDLNNSAMRVTVLSANKSLFKPNQNSSGRSKSARSRANKRAKAEKKKAEPLVTPEAVPAKPQAKAVKHQPWKHRGGHSKRGGHSRGSKP